MPTYDYRCRSCSHEFEEFQSITAPALKKCPKCGKNVLERLIGTGAALMFKGSGFYQTDYRSEGYKKAAEADTSAKPKSDGAAQAKPDVKAVTETPAKPAPKSESKPPKKGKAKP